MWMIERDQWKFLTVLGVLLLAFGIGIYLPAYYQRSKIHERIDAAKAELGIDPAALAGLNRYHTRVIALREEVSGAQRYVPQVEEIASVLRGLTQSLDAHDTAQPEVLTGAARRFADYSVVPVSLRFEAPFPAAFGVLDRIESMPRLIRIDELHFQADARRLDAPMSVQLELSTFFSTGAERSKEDAS